MKDLTEYEMEAAAMKTMAMLKLSEGELTVDSLKRILDRVYDLGNFIGRSRGEYYMKERMNQLLREYGGMKK